MRTRTPARRMAWFGVLLGLAAAASTGAGAATVRGRATCSAPGHAASGLYYVTVFRGDIGQSKPGTMTNDGTFYLYHVPPGPANLQIWSKQNPAAAPRVFQITVAEPYTQVPPFALTC